MRKDEMILVTGACGFIGSNLLRHLLQCGYTHIVGVDNFGIGDKWRNVVSCPGVSWYSPAQAYPMLSDGELSPAAILHLGAISSTTERNVDMILENNYHTTLRLWRYCSRAGIPFIYASSAATYGHGEHGFDDDASMEYLKRLQPLNAYGWSKHITDMEISRGGGFRGDTSCTVGLKFFNVYGAHEEHKGAQASVVLHFYRQAMSRGEVTVYTPDEADAALFRRDFVAVEDCVRVIIGLLEKPNYSGLLNVGTSQARAFEEIAAMMLDYFGLKGDNIRRVALPDELREQYQAYTCADIGRLRSLDIIDRFTPLKKGVQRYIGDYLSKHTNSDNE